MTRWSELRPTVASAILVGNLTTRDPVADDTEVVCRLYVMDEYYVLLVARWNGSVPARSVSITLPRDAAVLPRGNVAAVGIDAYTLSTDSSIPLAQTVVSNTTTVTVPSGFGFGAVVIPRATGAPGVVRLTPAVIPPLTSNNSSKISLDVIAPWNATMVVTVNIRSMGVDVQPSVLTLPGSITITAKSGATGFFPVMITSTGGSVLPTRRWVQVVPS